ncbi:hypothetical protein SAMN04488700_0953 [Carnobacterium iners]|uniref:Uncharacterized protein n=1 Tax=Carnobacterium iners TaxID=1073423 RepID=A0A1X7MUV6_9LACT|nr:hypothetical protein SAMN04488114_1366 [Carnobacterium iners]SMH28630.1 hypothetical protein SAMN04488700_0953 [Carnobacterium iners]
MNKKTFWILTITYAALTFLFHTILQTAFGAFLMTLSYFALVFAFIFILYSSIKFSIRLFFYKQKNDS